MFLWVLNRGDSNECEVILMSTHNICFYGGEAILMSTHNMFLWRNKQNYPVIITKYPHVPQEGSQHFYSHLKFHKYLQ